MATFGKTFFSLVAILVILQATTVSQANALSLIQLRGTLWCSPNGANTGGSQPLVNAHVTLAAATTGVVLATVTTGRDGVVNIVVTDLAILNTIQISQLQITVYLPVATCPVLALATGVLRGPTVGGVNGSIANLGIGVLVHTAV